MRALLGLPFATNDSAPHADKPSATVAAEEAFYELGRLLGR